MYKYETVIRMRNTDAAGLVFYAEVFVLAHECYESFLEEQGMSLASMIDEGDSLCFTHKLFQRANLIKLLTRYSKISQELTGYHIKCCYCPPAFTPEVRRHTASCHFDSRRAGIVP